MPKPTASVETITPQKAQYLLDNRAPNRNIAKSHVAYLLAEMRAGSWALNGETIKIDTEGRLIDGQHRLAAVVEYGKPVRFLVVRNVPASAFASIDQGRIRSAASVCAMAGIPNASTAASAARMFHNLLAIGSIDGHARKVPPRDIIATIQASPELVYSAGKASTYKIPRVLNKGVCALAHYLFSLEVARTHGTTHGRGAANSFFERLRDGTNLAKRHPILTLRARLHRDALTLPIASRARQYELIVRAWNAWRAGRTLATIPTTGNVPKIRG